MTICERSEPRLDIATKLTREPRWRQAVEPIEAEGAAQWRQTVYPSAGEIVLWQPAPTRIADEYEAEAELLTPSEARGHSHETATAAEAEADTARKKARSAASACARARTKVRRYAKANGLSRLFTLTFSTPVYDADEAGEIARRFFHRLQQETGRLPYLWVRERHKSGGVHLHFALDRPVAVRCGVPTCRGSKGLSVERIGGPCLSCTWGLGFVDARRLGKRKGCDRPRTDREAATAAASYLAKYVAKAYDEGEATVQEGQGKRRLHRYEVGQGFQPTRCDEDLPGAEAEVLTELGLAYFGCEPRFVWSSDVLGEEWEAPPVRVAFW